MKLAFAPVSMHGGLSPQGTISICCCAKSVWRLSRTASEGSIQRGAKCLKPHVGGLECSSYTWQARRKTRPGFLRTGRDFAASINCATLVPGFCQLEMQGQGVQSTNQVMQRIIAPIPDSPMVYSYATTVTGA
jgi:hypothetical protein